MILSRSLNAEGKNFSTSCARLDSALGYPAHGIKTRYKGEGIARIWYIWYIIIICLRGVRPRNDHLVIGYFSPDFFYLSPFLLHNSFEDNIKQAAKFYGFLKAKLQVDRR